MENNKKEEERDPARDVEMKRRDLGMKRRLQIFCTVNAHPGNGGSRGYPVEMRHAQIDNFLQGIPNVAHRSSIYRWMDRINPYLMQGNRERQVLVGVDQFLMCMCLFVWPHALTSMGLWT